MAAWERVKAWLGWGGGRPPATGDREAERLRDRQREVEDRLNTLEMEARMRRRRRIDTTADTWRGDPK
jgi:hypothetical protein